MEENFSSSAVYESNAAAAASRPCDLKNSQGVQLSIQYIHGAASSASFSNLIRNQAAAVAVLKYIMS
jgi:hypothetical protein